MVTNAGKIRVQSGGVTLGLLLPTGTGTSISLNTWYRVEMTVSGQSTTDGHVVVKVTESVSGAVVGSVDVTSANVSVNPLAGGDFGSISSGTPVPFTVDIDNVRFDDGSTTLLGAYVGSANALPTGTIGAAQTVALNAAVTVSATASDSDGTIASRAWDFESWPVGISKPSFTSGAASGTAVFTAAAFGRYVLTHTITDNSGGSTVLKTKVFVPADSAKVIEVTSVGTGWTVTGTNAQVALSDGSDASYVTAPDSPSGESKIVATLAPMNPKTSFALSLRHALTASGTNTVRLKEGSTVRKTWTAPTTSGTETDSLTMTAAECATISSWLELVLEFAKAA